MGRRKSLLNVFRSERALGRKTSVEGVVDAGKPSDADKQDPSDIDSRRTSSCSSPCPPQPLKLSQRVPSYAISSVPPSENNGLKRTSEVAETLSRQLSHIEPTVLALAEGLEKSQEAVLQHVDFLTGYDGDPADARRATEGGTACLSESQTRLPQESETENQACPRLSASIQNPRGQVYGKKVLSNLLSCIQECQKFLDTLQKTAKFEHDLSTDTSASPDRDTDMLQHTQEQLTRGLEESQFGRNPTAELSRLLGEEKERTSDLAVKLEEVEARSKSEQQKCMAAHEEEKERMLDVFQKVLDKLEKESESFKATKNREMEELSCLAESLANDLKEEKSRRREDKEKWQKTENEKLALELMLLETRRLLRWKTSVYADTMAQLEAERRKTQLAETQSLTLGDHSLTPRSLLMMFSSQQLGMPVASGSDVSRLVFCPITPGTLDLKLSGEELQSMFSLLKSQKSAPFLNFLRTEVSIRPCQICGFHKFDPPPSRPNEIAILDEYPRFPQPMQLKSNNVCTKCRLPHLVTDFERHVWTDMATDEIFRLVKNQGDFATILRCLGDPEIGNTLRIYEACMDLRRALSWHDSFLPALAIRISCDLHLRMKKAGIMAPFFDSQFFPTEPDDNGSIPPFDPGTIRNVRVYAYEEGTSVDVPVFMKFFNRSAKVVECSVCSEKYRDIRLLEEDWKVVCGREYDHEWLWALLHFPPAGTKSGCQHEPDVCRRCYNKFLAAQLEQLGSLGCEQIACPTLGCGNLLQYEDIRRMASKKTFKLYDRYRLLKQLSGEEGFMWCLRPGCQNGQIYDPDDEMVICAECSFEMCFRHRGPWHTGLTCVDYAANQGDPNSSGTREWIEGNSQACPNKGCGVRIEKNLGCDHMTCTICSHEFCWYCLGEWDGHSHCRE